MNQAIDLTLEQEFDLRRFADQVQGMSHEQAQDFLVMQHRFMIVRETMYKQLLKHEWQLDPDFVSHQTEKES
jgi:Phycobilisome degradation protein nblA